MEIKVLGSGCMKCRAAEEVVREALEELGVGAEVEHVKDLNEI